MQPGRDWISTKFVTRLTNIKLQTGTCNNESEISDGGGIGSDERSSTSFSSSGLSVLMALIALSYGGNLKERSDFHTACSLEKVQDKAQLWTWAWISKGNISCSKQQIGKWVALHKQVNGLLFNK